MAKKGELVVWGDNGAQQISKTPPGDDFASVAPGGFKQSLAIRTNGSLALWGGVGVPQPVKALPALTGEIFVDAALGLMHVVAIRADSSIGVWGDFVTAGPVTPPFAVKASAVAAASEHWVAIDAKNQTLVQWPTPGPGAVAPPKGKFIKVGARNDYIIALRNDHRLFAWGGTAFPANGIPSSPSRKSSGVSGPIDLNVKTFLEDWQFDGQGHYFVHGKFDFPITDAPPHLEVRPSDDRIVDIAAGVIQKTRGNIPHILALRADGTVIGWGPQKGPETKAPVGMKFKKIAAGLRFSVGIDEFGSLRHWGIPGALATVPAGHFSSIGAAVQHATAVRASA